MGRIWNNPAICDLLTVLPVARRVKGWYSRACRGKTGQAFHGDD